MMRLPDVTVRGSTVPSTDFRTLCQRRLGLHTSCLTVALDTCEQRGLPVTQHDRLGDKAINSHNATQRHNEGLAAIYSAIRCASTTANAVRIGDKGDGTPCGKADTLSRRLRTVWSRARGWGERRWRPRTSMATRTRTWSWTHRLAWRAW